MERSQTAKLNVYSGTVHCMPCKMRQPLVNLAASEASKPAIRKPANTTTADRQRTTTTTTTSDTSSDTTDDTSGGVESNHNFLNISPR